MIAPYIAQQNVDDFGLRFSSLIYSVTIAVPGEAILVVPSDCPRYKAIIKANQTAEVWLALNQTAAPPVGATFALSGSELLPIGYVVCREVKSADEIHVYANTVAQPAQISISLYALGTINGY